MENGYNCSVSDYPKMNFNKPNFTSCDPFTSLGRHSFSFLDDDFLNKLVVIKLNNYPTTNSFNLKSTLLQDKSGYNLSDEIKMWFMSPKLSEGSWVWLRLKKDALKVHFQPKSIENQNSIINLGLSFATNRVFTDWSVRPSINIDRTQKEKNLKCNLGMRFKISPQNLFLYSRFSLTKDQFKFASYAVANLHTKSLIKKSFLLGLCRPNYDFYVRTEDTWNSKPENTDLLSWLGKATATLIMKKEGKNFVGAQVVYEKGMESPDMSLVVERKISNQVDSCVKGKIRKDMSIDLSYKHKLYETVSFTLGINGNLNNYKEAKGGILFDLMV